MSRTSKTPVAAALTSAPAPAILDAATGLPETGPGGGILPTPRADPSPQAEAEPYNPLIDGHIPPDAPPLTTAELDNACTETKRLRHDGWTPERRRDFLEALSNCGVVIDACRHAGMSARAAYNLRDRDALFAAGWAAACHRARAPLADEAYSRAMNGVVDRIYKDGCIVAERHRYDNRLTMAVLARLDAEAERAAARDDPALRLAANWHAYLDALAEDRREDGLALLAGPDATPTASEDEEPDAASRREHHEHDPVPPRDPHIVWKAEGRWWTDYPPPPDYDGDEQGDYGRQEYRRTLSSEEQAAWDQVQAEEDAEALALAAAQRDSMFGFKAKAPRRNRATRRAGAAAARRKGRGKDAEGSRAKAGTAALPSAPA